MDFLIVVSILSIVAIPILFYLFVELKRTIDYLQEDLYKLDRDLNILYGELEKEDAQNENENN